MSNSVVYVDRRSAKAEEAAARIHSRIQELVLGLRPTSVLEIGSGRGVLGARVAARGIRYVGIEPVEAELAIARATYPDLSFVHASCYDIPKDIGQFDLVVSNDVVEHLYDPRALARVSREHLVKGGYIVCGTPEYGDYWRNVLLSVAGKWDAHHGPLWDGGHIKFFSRTTLEQLWREEGFTGFEWGNLNYRIAPFISWYLHCTARLT